MPLRAAAFAASVLALALVFVGAAPAKKPPASTAAAAGRHDGADEPPDQRGLGDHHLARVERVDEPS